MATLNTVRAVVKDVPMDSVYADEESNLKIGKVLPEFLRKHASRLWRRYIYNYLVRDFNVGTLYSLSGVMLVLLGTFFGLGFASGAHIAGLGLLLRLLGCCNNAEVMFRMLQIAFCHHGIAGGLRIASKLQIFFRNMMRRSANLHVWPVGFIGPGERIGAFAIIIVAATHTLVLTRSHR